MEQTNKYTIGTVFNIQRYSIHDGPGIRTTVFLKGCPLRCFWCQNPESQAIRPEVFLDKSKCSLCGRCVAICPTGAASLLGESSTIDRSICVGCGKCAEVCPNEARRLIGRRMTVDEVMRQILKDVRFYENSGGGVTLSGGEPLAQPHFCFNILRKCKEEGFHTLLDTCGLAPWSNLREILIYTDLVLFDIKHMDPAKHIFGAGESNASILENAKRVAQLKPMRVRIPLIPSFNDSPEDIIAIAGFVKSRLGISVDIDLLPYNDMAGKKYEMLDRPYTPAKTQNDNYVQSLRQVIVKCE